MLYFKKLLLFLLLTSFQVLLGQDFYEEKKKFMENRVDSIRVGNPIPDFTMFNEQQKKVEFRSLLGKIIVIDIWATWCKPCILLSPEFERVNEKYGNEELVFLSISIDQEKEKWLNYIEKHPVNYDRYWVGDDKNNPIKWFTFQEIDFSGNKVWAESIPKFIIVDKEGLVEALDFGQPGMYEFKKAVKAAQKN